MMREFAVGEEATINYQSTRSGNIVSRTGEVLQVPTEEKRGLFIQSDENQWTCVIDSHVFSFTISIEDGKRTIDRKVKLGTLNSLEEA